MEFSGQALTRARGRATQADLAERTGLSVFTINRLENGRHKPQFETIVKIAQALDVPIDELLDHQNGDAA